MHVLANRSTQRLPAQQITLCGSRLLLRRPFVPVWLICEQEVIFQLSRTVHGATNESWKRASCMLEVAERARVTIGSVAGVDAIVRGRKRGV